MSEACPCEAFDISSQGVHDVKFKAGIICALAGVLAVPVIAQAGDGDKTTGGGQVVVGPRGAGDTIAWTAQQTGDAVKGNVTFQDRDGGTGKGHTTYHGKVSCVDAVGNVAQVAGTWRDGGQFHIYIEDNGEGANANSDIVTLTPMATDPDCSEDPPDEKDQVALARGNAQVRDGDAQQTRKKTMSFKTALNLAGVR
jgi:hypothetical protein